MLTTWLWTIASVVVISLISVIGVITLMTNEKRLCKIISALVGLATGALFGSAFVHLLPKIFAETNRPVLASFFILTGMAIFFILEKFLHWHHHHHHHRADQHIKPVGYLNLMADGMHNLIDGIIVGVAYLISIEVGLATTLAVVLHEIPQEIGDFGLLIHAGFTKTKALYLNLLSACLAIVGAILALALGPKLEGLTVYALAMAAGGFIYIAGSDLVPELHKETELKKTAVQLISISLGVGLMFLMLLIE